MSLRGSQGSRGRGRGRGSRRGRGRGKTVIWEWENYSPGPEVYDSLWHIRKEPATVSPNLPTACPLPNAQTRITDRRQTEGHIQRNFYVVEVTYTQPRDVSASNGPDPQPTRTEILHVDLSRILQYVSPDELERYENEQFRIEAEAEEVAKRAEAEELARRRLEKNARALGAGKGSRMLSGLGLDTGTRLRGRPKGRGRGRGRGRSSWRGRGALVMHGLAHDRDTEEHMVDVESNAIEHRTEEDVQHMLAETDSEEDTVGADARVQISPGLSRSAFVANSALIISPARSVRPSARVPTIQRGNTEDADVESELESIDANSRSVSSAATHLRREHPNARSDDHSEDESLHFDRQRGKRRRTDSTASNKPMPLAQTTIPDSHSQRKTPQIAFTHSDSQPSSSTEADILGKSIPSQRHALQSNGANTYSGPTQPQNAALDLQREEQEDEDEDGEEEEYVVESIIEHYREAGKKHYLVKWQGYNDSYDWLPEEDLEGAAEMVAEYNKRVKKRKEKGKMAKLFQQGQS